MFSQALTVLFISASIQVGCSQAALRANSTQVGLELADRSLRAQVAALLGQGDATSTARLEALQAELKPMFLSLPKHEGGGLEHGVARYALHRFFLHRHGWHVQALEASGAERWQDASPIAAFANRVPDYVLKLLERRFGDGRLGLQELAIMAATLEGLVHSEAIEFVSTAYAAQDASVHEDVPQDLEDMILKTYLLFHTKPNPNYTRMERRSINLLLTKAPVFLSGFNDTVLWMKDLRYQMDMEVQSHVNPFSVKAEGFRSFDSFVRLVEDFGEGFGQFQNLECQSMKSALVDLDDIGNGRVRLSKFYSPALENRQPFSESPAYLRHLGVLDESDPRGPSVIIANYLNSRSNCIASSKFYAICCIDECEGLMSHLERRLNAPTAHPKLIADLIATIPSQTVAAPRNISATLRGRLAEIADRHGGEVPIHGRLFAQWMHHVYPNECQYPHVSGSIDKQMRPADWKNAAPAQKRNPRLSKDEMKVLIEADSNFTDERPVEAQITLPWTEEEELVAPTAPRSQSNWSACARLLVLALAMSSAGVGIFRMIRAPMRATLPTYVAKTEGLSWWPLGPKAHFV